MSAWPVKHPKQNGLNDFQISIFYLEKYNSIIFHQILAYAQKMENKSLLTMTKILFNSQ